MTKAGFADHKPPYDFKHGWVPVSPAAKEAAPDKPVVRKPKRPRAGERDYSSDLQKRIMQQIRNDEYVQVRAHKDLTSLSEEWGSATTIKGGLSPAEAEVIEEYQWGESEYGLGEPIYEKMNEFKRHGPRPHMTAEEMAELDRVNVTMLRALDRSKTSRDITVYRGLHGGQPPITVGDTITDAAWVSTSVDPMRAFEFATMGNHMNWGYKGKDKVLAIQLPKGTPALQAASDEEHEILLGPETPLRVVREDERFIYMEPA